MLPPAPEHDMANALRALAMDAVQAANSGHPGMPMGMAEIAVALWHRNLQHNPANPAWPNRDRFVLSNGHGSMLLYALLHLTGYDLPLAELKRFRQLGSKTPGHPERGLAPGVETTTGPLGQGIANAVGMAIAERLLAAEFNRPGHGIVDHRSYVFLGDGCMMEGVSHEACALAGTLGLSKLIAVYDDNGISIDSEKGSIRQWYTDDVRRRFESYGWQVIAGVDGHDIEAVDRALGKARRESKRAGGRPTLICANTIIGKGAPTKANTGAAHGAPLGEKEVAATRAAIGWNYPAFEVPDGVRLGWNALERGRRAERRWKRAFGAYEKAHPELAREFLRRMKGDLPSNFSVLMESYIKDTNLKAETVATRKASQNALEVLVPALPELVGGSADLAGSNLTIVKGSKSIGKEEGGNYLFYGVREFGMGAVMNGLALHGGCIPYGGTFLVFSDYMRSSVRMAALMGLRTIYVFTHDSIGLGEDGPTHQPIEHAASLRLIPNLDVWRPCDTLETAIAWTAALQRKNGPTALLLSRQNLPFEKRDEQTRNQIQKGGYVLSDAPGAKAVIIATGSEVQLALAAQKLLDFPVRVVSLPSTSAFDRQDEGYRASVLPKHLPRVAVESGVTDYWRKYVGSVDDPQGAVIGIDRFGESAPAGELFKHFGLTPENVAKAVRSVVK
ncbi:MAG TPA: transketolase [Burkholderiales bacterium]|nr:transketolase [Burkholderiales bacterium]